jgi:hypothetical protein
LRCVGGGMGGKGGAVDSNVSRGVAYGAARQ